MKGSLPGSVGFLAIQLGGQSGLTWGLDFRRHKLLVPKEMERKV